MNATRCLIACGLTLLATAAFAEEWEEVFQEKNSLARKFYFDKNITRLGKNSVKTQYMIVESKNREAISGGPKRPFNRSVYLVRIDCSANLWTFLRRTYSLDNKIQFEEDTGGGSKNTTPPPPQGSAPFTIGEKACALR